MKPAIILVHPAFADGSIWTKVIAGLQKQGFPVIAAQIPLTSLSDDATALRRVLERAPGPALVVAHSYAGAVITKATGDLANVKGLIYIAAMAPATGETVAELLHRAEPHPLGPVLAPDEHGLIWMSREGFAKAVAPDASAEEIDLMTAIQKPISIEAIREAMTAPAWAVKPSWYLLAKNDRVIAPETQRFMASRMNAHLTEAETDHSPLVSAPELVLALIEQAAA